MSRILNNTWLMWIGSDNYHTIDEWIEEAEEMGVSKRLPNCNVGAALRQEGTVVFVAHDEGIWKNCSDCLGKIENPEWRKKTQEICNLMDVVTSLKEKRDEVVNDEGDVDSLKKLNSLNRKIVRREKVLDVLRNEITMFTKRVDAGSGGEVVVINRVTGKKEKIDYRQYNYWLHQPKRFDEMWQVVGIPKMCSMCGGTGQLPEAKVFGLFIPTDVEYILKDDDDEMVKQKMKDLGFALIDKKRLGGELKRKCGYRHSGGVYAVVNNADADKKKIKKFVKKLVSAGVVNPDGVEIKGNFMRFLQPISVDEKRFRGIKKWNIEGNSFVKNEAEMIVDALE
jgi:hypothetical protein